MILTKCDEPVNDTIAVTVYINNICQFQCPYNLQNVNVAAKGKSTVLCAL